MIYWFAPPPGSKSGLAVYARDLLPQLRKHAEVEWVQAGAAVPTGARRVYNLGNHPANAPVLARALAEPDAVLLHDTCLHHAALALGRSEEAFGDGGRAARLRERGVWMEPYEVLDPALLPLLGRQKLVLVHSEYARETLAMRGVETPVAVIPMGVVVPEGKAEKDPCSIGLFGHLGANRRAEEVLDRTRRLRKRFPGLALKAVGASVPAALDGQPGVEVLRDLPDAEFFSQLARVTVFWNLRYPVTGETSLTTLQAMALGTVCAVLDLGSYAELPDDAVLKVAPNEDWTEAVGALLADGGKRLAMEEAGRAWVRERHSPERWATAVGEALCGSRN
jgi:glycosyltransferase involved in cell wall biosynthesis